MKDLMPNRVIAFCGLLVFFTLGCTDVMLRPGLPDYVSKLNIPTFENRTSQPNLENEITQQLVQDFLIDGRIHLADPGTANAILNATVVRYTQDPIRVDVHNTPQQYKMTIILLVALKDVKAGKNLWNEDNFEESTTYYVPNSLGIQFENETDARRRLIEQLCSRLVAKVIEGF
jgi:hypothetical protein